MDGYFIVFEGLDGSGKTTQAMLLRDYLTSNSLNVLHTREPTNGPIGQKIRAIAANLDNEVNSDDWASLFIEDRQQHLDNDINPAIANGTSVISDRYMMSTIAYQTAQGGEMEYLFNRHHGMRNPDLTIFLDITHAKALERIYKLRGGATESFEAENSLKKTVQAYRQAVWRFGEEHNVVIFDGELDIKKIQKNIRKRIDLLYGHI